MTSGSQVFGKRNLLFQPLNHLDIQPIKRCFIFTSLPISFPLTTISVPGKNKGEIPFLCDYWGTSPQKENYVVDRFWR
jgi:hypothetical protein